jgi:hypothetical protein
MLDRLIQLYIFLEFFQGGGFVKGFLNNTFANERRKKALKVKRAFVGN